ncbi:MAG: dockerin type I repeat-containing protein [Clostridia bacterium]|nr:dockerin type I repeat-containing protein [Clostridia bacterium]
MKHMDMCIQKVFKTVVAICVLISVFFGVVVSADVSYNETLRLHMTGDVDEDSTITSTDARLILQHVVGKIPKDALNITLADVDGDGDVTSTDARLALQFFAEKETVITCPPALPHTRVDTASGGEAVPFEVVYMGEATNAYPAGTANEYLFLAQNAEEWRYLRTVYGLSETYDDAYFNEYALLLVDAWMSNLQQQLEVSSITKIGTTCQLYLHRYNERPDHSPMRYRMVAVIALPKAALETVADMVVYADTSSPTVD